MLLDLARADRVQGASFDKPMTPGGRRAFDRLVDHTKHPGAVNTEAADQLLEVVRTYLR